MNSACRFKVLLLGEQDNHIQAFETDHVFDMQDVFDGLCVLSIKKVIPKGPRAKDKK
jgi:hypothetical protein